MKKSIIKGFKIILPLLIGVYLTWYFVSNAITAEKRSFYITSSLSETTALEYYQYNNSTFQNNISFIEDSTFKATFSFYKSITLEDFKNENVGDEKLVREIFLLSESTLSKPILTSNGYKLIYLSNIQPEITKEDFIASFSNVNYFWIILALFIALLSHMSRAYRWKYLLEPLDIKPKLSLMYHSVMIGYIINLTIPRSGEVARAAYFSKYQNSSSEKVFGTIVVERVIDLLMFGLVFLITIFLQTDQDRFTQIRQAESSGLPSWVFPLIIAGGVILFVTIIGIKRLREKAIKFIKGVLEGCLTILKLKNKRAFILHTLFIWVAYILMLFITALSIPQMQSIDVSALFACFIAGTIAIGATPGGIGLYPIMVASVLIQLYGYQQESANAFGIIMWTTQTLFMIILGLISLVAIKKES
ncbi:MAG: lysylphosphatidylglycerol synthase transmembrane domain-containing protein [Parvicellaceae bacterium]